jgi:opacity protein-like surface antigen
MLNSVTISRTIIAAAMLVVAGAAPASAQVGAPWIDRGYFNFNIGFESTSGTLTDSTTFQIYDEIGTRSIRQNVDSGSFIDFSVGSRVWRNVSVGIGFHRGSNTSEADGDVRVPHPLVFGQAREATIAAGDLNRTEQAFHVQVGYMLPVNDDLSVHVTAGPSFFRLKQDVLSDLSFTEQAPFSTVNVSAATAERSDAAVGVNAGVDVTYKVWESEAYKVGAGVFLRYAGASARITVLENEVDSDVGGLQFGLGARIRF